MAKRKPKPSAIKRKRGRRDVPHRGRTKTLATRVQGPNGTWPINTPEVAPRRPIIMFLYEDMNDLDEAPPSVFGMYPVRFISKVAPLLIAPRSKILHVCSGALPRGEGIRVDVRPEAKPDIIADGRKLPFANASVEAVLIDPPYNQQYAKDLYGTEYPRPSHLLAEAARVVRPGGRIGIVHYITPNPPDNCTFVLARGLSTGFGYPMRAITIYQRDQDRLPGL